MHGKPGKSSAERIAYIEENLDLDYVTVNNCQ
jgi:hypothetical protein